MTRPVKKKPAPKGRPPRRKKNNLKKLAPVLVIAGAIAIFVGWRAFAVLSGATAAVERPKVHAEKAHGKGKVRETPVEKAPGRSEEPAAAKPEIAPPAPKAPEIKKAFGEKEAPAGKQDPSAGKPGRPRTDPGPINPPLPKPPAAVVSPPGTGRVAIVIDDVGSSIELLREAARCLPKSVTFAVMPFMPYSTESADLLRKEGFRVILHSPMEAEDPCKCRSCISAGMTRKQVADTLDLQFDSVPFAEGLNNHTGSRATKDRALMSFVMEELKKRGLFFLDSRTTPFTQAFSAAREAGVRAAERKVFLDDESIESGILLKMDELALAGMKEKKAVGIGHLRPATIKALSKRIPYWQARGVVFIPLAEAVD